MRVPSPLLAAAFTAAIVSAPLRPSAAEPGTREDVIAALGMRADIRAQAAACEEKTGSYGWLFRWSEHFWEGGNLAALRYADHFTASLPPGERAALQGAVDAFGARERAAREPRNPASPGADDLSGCEDLLSRLQDHEHRHDLLGPDVEPRLRNAYAALRGGNEAARIEQRHEDMVIGCMKSALRQGQRELTPARATCECVIAAVESAATPAEIDAYNVSTSGPAGRAVAEAEVLKAPWLQAALPKMQACGGRAR
jgi:hypothetical protein